MDCSVFARIWLEVSSFCPVVHIAMVVGGGGAQGQLADIQVGGFGFCVGVMVCGGVVTMGTHLVIDLEGYMQYCYGLSVRGQVTVTLLFLLSKADPLSFISFWFYDVFCF
jgi:hypothetical protein